MQEPTRQRIVNERPHAIVAHIGTEREGVSVRFVCTYAGSDTDRPRTCRVEGDFAEHGFVSECGISDVLADLPVHFVGFDGNPVPTPCLVDVDITAEAILVSPWLDPELDLETGVGGFFPVAQVGDQSSDTLTAIRCDGTAEGLELIERWLVSEVARNGQLHTEFADGMIHCNEGDWIVLRTGEHGSSVYVYEDLQFRSQYSVVALGAYVEAPR